MCCVNWKVSHGKVLSASQLTRSAAAKRRKRVWIFKDVLKEVRRGPSKAWKAMSGFCISGQSIFSPKRNERGSLDGEAALVGATKVSETEVLGVAAEVEFTDELGVLLLAAAQDGELLGLQALLLDLLQVGENELVVNLLPVDVGQLNGSVDVDSLREQGDLF